MNKTIKKWEKSEKRNEGFLDLLDNFFIFIRLLDFEFELIKIFKVFRKQKRETNTIHHVKKLNRIVVKVFFEVLISFFNVRIFIDYVK